MVLALACLLVACLFSPPARADGASYNPPNYTAQSIVNAASYSAAALAPNAIVSIYGTWLSYETVPLSAANLSNGGLPTTLGGVTVYVGGSMAGLYYVSPGQINFLMPNILSPGDTTIFVEREGLVGPVIPITLNAAAPAFFSDVEYNIVGQHADDGSVIDADSPAQPNEWVILYAEGLGPTIPEELPYELASVVAPISMIQQFSVLIDGTAVDPTFVYYAGITPGFAGLYQINLLLPANIGADPEILIQIGSMVSATSTHLFVE